MEFKSLLGILVNLPKTIFFNFHYLKFNEAVKLPIIFLSSVKLVGLKGQIKFSCKVKPGIVRIGGGKNPLYLQQNYRCVWANYGGVVTFSDKVSISKGVAMEIGSRAHLSLGHNVYFGALSRISCYKEILIDENSRFTWENIVCDTDFHPTINVLTGERSEMCKTVRIGKNNWMGIRCFVMKGTETPDYCIASAYSLLNKKYDVPKYSLIGGVPAKFLKGRLYRDLYTHVNDSEQQRLNCVENE